MRLLIQLLLASCTLLAVANKVAGFDDIMYDVHQQLQVRRMVDDENSEGQVALAKRENNEFMELLDSETTNRRKRENNAPPNIAVDPPEYGGEEADRKKRENNGPPEIAVDPPEYGPEKRSPPEQPESASEEGVAKRDLQGGPPQPESASEEGVAKRRKRRNTNPSSLSKSTGMEARKRRDVGILLGDSDSPYDQHKYHCWAITSPDMCLQHQGCEWKHNYCYVPYSSMSKVANDFVLKWLLRDI